jgi:hypothetical protein
MTLIALILAGIAYVYWTASRSRKRKQRIAEAAWRESFTGRLQLRMNALGLPLTVAQAAAEEELLFADLYHCFRVRDFASLMRRLTTADPTQSEECATIVCSKSARRLGTPAGVSEDTVAAMIRLALNEAGSTAQDAADQSGEV